MTNLSWQPKVDLGITTLDNQYKALFEILEILDEAITYRDTASRLEKISNLIKQSCLHIYNYERPLLNMANDDASRRQILLYRAFLDRVHHLDIEIVNGDTLTAARKLKFEIKCWLNKHLDHLDEHIAEKRDVEQNKINKKGISAFLNYFR